MDDRKNLLIAMYNQLFNDINRHIIVIWQSISVVIATFALFSLSEKGFISIDIACSVIILSVAWLLSHVYDAAYWYNRNLVMIANIERQFLSKEDLKEIHYYFGKHRDANSMLTHLKIQRAFGIGIGILVILFHILNRILPDLTLCGYKIFLTTRILPYLMVIGSFFFITKLGKNRENSYKEFLLNSPGKEIDINGQ